jgi:hypothetical protein
MGSKKSKNWVKERTLNRQFFADMSFHENHEHVENFQKNSKLKVLMIQKILKNWNPRLLTKSKNHPTPVTSILGKGRVSTFILAFGFFNSLCSYWICSN